MNHLLLVAHGSRRASSNEEVHRLAEQLKSLAGTQYADVSVAFLELVEPSIPAAIQTAIDKAAQEIIVLPYFLSRGRHVVTDVPTQVQIKQTEYPQVKITIAPYLGAEQASLAALLLEILSKHHE